MRVPNQNFSIAQRATVVALAGDELSRRLAMAHFTRRGLFRAVVGLLFLITVASASRPAPATYLKKSSPVLAPSLTAADLERQAEASFDKAHLVQAFGLYQKALTKARTAKDVSREAKILTGIARTYDGLAQYDREFDSLNQSLSLFRQLGNKSEVSAVLGQLAVAYSDIRRYDKALDYAQQSLALAQTIGKTETVATSLYVIGYCYLQLGRASQASDYFLRVLAIARQTGDEELQERTFLFLGDTAHGAGDSGKAVAYYGRALLLSKKINDKSSEAVILTDLATEAEVGGVYDEALDYYRQSLILSRSLGDKSSEAASLSNIGNLYQQLNQYAVSTNYYTQALPLQTAVGDMAGEAVTLMDIGSLYQRVSQFSKAEAYYQKALSIEEVIHDQEGQAQSYSTLMQLRDAAGDRSEAIKYGRMCCTLLDSIAASLKTDDARQSFKASHHAAYDKLAELEIKQQPVLDITRFGSRAPIFAKMQTALRASASKGDKIAVLSTIVGDNACDLILVTPEFVVSYRSSIQSSELRSLVTSFRNALQSPATDPRPFGKRLYDLLLNPIAGDLDRANAGTILWSPDDCLQSIPICALYDGSHYVAERYQTANVNNPLDLDLTPGTLEKRVLAFGVSTSQSGSPALPGVRTEISSIKNCLPTTVYLDEDVTHFTMFESLAKHNHSIVHIAAHIAFDKDAISSYLQLGDGTHLSLEELNGQSGLFHNIDLVVLSNCSFSPNSAGRGFVGPFVFLSGGVQSVVSCLWPPSDSSTSLLMGAFYRNLANGMSKAEALRQAQLSMLHGAASLGETDRVPFRSPVTQLSVSNGAGRPRLRTTSTAEVNGTDSQPAFNPDPKAPYSHPYYWASFLLTGNPR